MTVENVTDTSVEWRISTDIRDVTLVESLLNAKNVGKTSDVTPYFFGIR